MAAKNQNVAKKLTLPKDFGKMIAGATACYLALALHLYRPYIPKFDTCNCQMQLSVPTAGCWQPVVDKS